MTAWQALADLHRIHGIDDLPEPVGVAHHDGETVLNLATPADVAAWAKVLRVEADVEHIVGRMRLHSVTARLDFGTSLGARVTVSCVAAVVEAVR